MRESSELIKELLEITKIKQKGLAKIAEVSQGTVSKWKDDDHGPSVAAWGRILRFALSDPRTEHLAHRYILGLFGSDPKALAAFVQKIIIR